MDFKCYGSDGSHFHLTVELVILPIILVSSGPHCIEVTALNIRYDDIGPKKKLSMLINRYIIIISENSLKSSVYVVCWDGGA